MQTELDAEMQDDFDPSRIVIYDSKNNIEFFGEYKGSFIIKLHGDKDTSETIIFSDNVVFSSEGISVKGLHIGVMNNSAFSQNLHSKIAEYRGEVDYVVQLNPEIVKEFDAARFSAIYPNIIRFLHTTCLYTATQFGAINHLTFVKGEIMNRPVGITKNGGIIIGDRVVIDDQLQPIFYDSILINRDENEEITVAYDPFGMISMSYFRFLVLLGAENF